MAVIVELICRFGYDVLNCELILNNPTISAENITKGLQDLTYISNDFKSLLQSTMSININKFSRIKEILTELSQQFKI